MELLGTRVTPSPRKRDPKLAKKPGAVWMTERQKTLWAQASGGKSEAGYYMAGVHRHPTPLALDFLCRLNGAEEPTITLLEDGQTIEIKVKRHEPKH